MVNFNYKYPVPSEGYTLEYNNGKVSKRTGGYRCILAISCQNDNDIFDDRQVFYDVAYKGNTVKITTRSPEGWSWLKQEWLFQMHHSNQIEYLIYKAENRVMYDSLAYTYNTSGKISQIWSYGVYRDDTQVEAVVQTVKDFTFNGAENLEKVETRVLLSDGFVISLIVEEFGNYDTAVNPLQHLFMFEDTYYRTLSKNNFRKYSIHYIDAITGANTGLSGREWTLYYNQSGMPQFDKL
ncbi:hypothetical protein DXT99_05200 [Pontibacter diazotrophicus]|uniref:Uncharacterized protein n=2 Tax=Pontibacter diazotrophicus TaxID=1400979 RepID=A0A3D8LF91_9BACT|nr:hypothetical protein DXT99_05200 [Pontibacter diazotrophicus]